MEVFLWDLQVKLSFDRFLQRGSLLQTEDMCLSARLSQDNIEHMFFLLTVGAGHTHVILYTLTTHKYTDLGIFPTVIPSKEGCWDSEWELKVHAQPYRRLSSIFSVLFYFFPCNIQIQEYFQTINTCEQWVPCKTVYAIHVRKTALVESPWPPLCTQQSLFWGDSSSQSSDYHEGNEVPSGWTYCLWTDRRQPVETQCLLFWQLMLGYKACATQLRGLH